MKQHSPQFLALVAKAKKRIKEITPESLKEKLDQHQSFHLLDVREEGEWRSGYIPTASHLSKGVIERDIEKIIPDMKRAIVVYCSGGFRSVLVADILQKMGYQNVSSLEGGLGAWLDAGYNIEQ